MLDTIPGCPKPDAIVFNSVLRYGIDDLPTADRSFIGFARLLAPAALLVVSWNKYPSEDPQLLPECSRLFNKLRDLAIAARRDFDASTHVYDFLVRNDTATD